MLFQMPSAQCFYCPKISLSKPSSALAWGFQWLDNFMPTLADFCLILCRSISQSCCCILSFCSNRIRGWRLDYMPLQNEIWRPFYMKAERRKHLAFTTSHYLIPISHHQYSEPWILLHKHTCVSCLWPNKCVWNSKSIIETLGDLQNSRKSF